jgi:endonuclease G
MFQNGFFNFGSYVPLCSKNCQVKQFYPITLALVLLACTLNSQQAKSACTSNTPASGITECHYQRFSTWVSCKHKGNLMSWFELSEDVGSENTKSRNYKLDPEPALDSCQQISNDTYVQGHDVGHIAAIDHFDESTENALETNFMTNLLPQASSFNRSGAWRKSERMTECYRDEDGYAPLSIYAGPVYGKDTSNDLFSSSHGLNRNPDHYWKILYSASKNEYDAWVMPNHNDSKSANLPSYRRTLSALITTLKDENDSVYNPVIGVIETIETKNPKQIEMRNNPRCHRRRG